MREIVARAVCVLTIGVVVALSFLFASAHNSPVAVKPVRSVAGPAPVTREANAASDRPGRIQPDRGPAAPPAGIERGRAVYNQQNCATCHSLADAGNPRLPLDGVGARRDATELRAWVTGTGAAADILPATTVKRKQRYQSMPADDLNALVAYLSSLQTAK